MSQLKQKDAVFQAVLNIVGNQDGAYSPTKEERAQINQILVESFKNGSVVYDGQLPEEKELRAYVSGLVSNWLRKDNRLNGGVAYVAKNPGSRTGNTDPQIKAMRALLATKTDEAERTEIQSFINRRLAEIKPAKATKTVDVNSLPEELKHLV